MEGGDCKWPEFHVGGGGIGIVFSRLVAAPTRIRHAQIPAPATQIVTCESSSASAKISSELVGQSSAISAKSERCRHFVRRCHVIWADFERCRARSANLGAISADVGHRLPHLRRCDVLSTKGSLVEMCVAGSRPRYRPVNISRFLPESLGRTRGLQPVVAARSRIHWAHCAGGHAATARGPRTPWGRDGAPALGAPRKIRPQWMHNSAARPAGLVTHNLVVEGVSRRVGRSHPGVGQIRSTLLEVVGTAVPSPMCVVHGAHPYMPTSQRTSRGRSRRTSGKRSHAHSPLLQNASRRFGRPFCAARTRCPSRPRVARSDCIARARRPPITQAAPRAHRYEGGAGPWRD